MIRSLALIAGLALVGAAAHVNILACGGYTQPTAIITLALAIGVAVGSVAIGNAAQNKRRTLAVFIAIGLLCGEGYALIATGERTISARDASVAPITAAVETRKLAEARVVAAELALASVAATSPRLDSAIAAKAAAETRAMDDASKKSCAANCRALLEAATSTAAREVDAARAEIAGFRLKAELRLADARAAVIALPAYRSASPLADRLGIAAWALDLLAAGLLSIGVNGLGAALIALSAHGRSLQLRAGAAVKSDPSVQHDEFVRPLQLNAQEIDADAVDDPKQASTGRRELDPELPFQLAPVAVAELPKPKVSGPKKLVSPPIVQDEQTAPAAVVTEPATDNVVTLPSSQPGRVLRFVVDALEPSNGGRIEVVELYDAYRTWCSMTRATALGADVFGDELQAAIDVASLEVKASRGKVFLLNVKMSDVAVAKRA
jgi:hypothetical protein